MSSILKWKWTWGEPPRLLGSGEGWRSTVLEWTSVGVLLNIYLLCTFGIWCCQRREGGGARQDLAVCGAQTRRKEKSAHDTQVKWALFQICNCHTKNSFYEEHASLVKVHRCGCHFRERGLREILVFVVGAMTHKEELVFPRLGLASVAVVKRSAIFSVLPLST